MRDATLLVIVGLAVLAMACASSSPSASSDAASASTAAVPADPGGTSGGGKPGDGKRDSAGDPVSGLEVAEDADREGLVEVDAPDLPGRFFASTSNRSLAEYRSMILEPVRISYPSGAQRFRDLDHGLLARQFSQDLRAAIAAGPDWKQVAKPGPDTLRVRVTLAEVEIDPLLGGGGGSAVTYADNSGGALLAFELLDSTTGQVLHRYMERRVLTAGMYSGGDVDRRRLASLFSEFAQGVETLLRRDVAGGVEADGGPSSRNGGP